MKPEYAAAATDLSTSEPNAYLAAVDATKSAKLSEKFKLQGFPTLKYFENGEFKMDYSLGRTRESITQFMHNPMGDPATTTTPSQNEDTWTDLTGHQIILQSRRLVDYS